MLLLLRLQNSNRNKIVHPTRTRYLLCWLLWRAICHSLCEMQQGNDDKFSTVEMLTKLDFQYSKLTYQFVSFFIGQVITSGGVTYKNEPFHRDCFTCTHCEISLAGQRFTSRDEKPYCADCFGELFAKRCTACTKPITGMLLDPLIHRIVH